MEHVIVATAKCSTGRLAGWRTVEAERRVRVTPAIDADAAPLLEPAHVARTKRLKRLLVPCGYVEASLCTHRTGFCPGDMVDVNVDVRNTSRDPLCEVILGLRETVRLTSGKEYSRTLLQTGNLIPADRQAVQENTIFATSASVPIPYEATYSEHAGDVLVSHALVATLKGPSGKKVASLVCPIFVATFHSQAAQAGLPEGLAVPSAPPYPAEKEVEVVEVGEEPILYNHSPLARNNFCVICMNHEQTHCAVPCGHKCMCQACAELAAKTGFCPMCRQNIDSIIRVYE